MDNYERVGYGALIAVAIVYIGAMFIGLVAILPYGIIGLVGIVGIGALLMKVVKERLENREDDYYAENVDK